MRGFLWDGRVVPHLRKCTSILALGLVAVACGGRAGQVAPSDPATTVRAFLNAVRANSLVAMGELWGSARGPASGFIEAGELEQRLTIIRVYLEHERFEILPPAQEALLGGGERVLRVRLTRKGCTPVVPFTLVRWRDGWLVSDIDLGAAGNPALPCRESPGPPARRG